MTARVVLNLDELADGPDAVWLGDLLAWQLPWSRRDHDRCIALVAIVAARYPLARTQPESWPTLTEIGSALVAYGVDLTLLLTVAVAGGWVRYEDVLA